MEFYRELTEVEWNAVQAGLPIELDVNPVDTPTLDEPIKVFLMPPTGIARRQPEPGA